MLAAGNGAMEEAARAVAKEEMRLIGSLKLLSPPSFELDALLLGQKSSLP